VLGSTKAATVTIENAVNESRVLDTLMVEGKDPDFAIGGGTCEIGTEVAPGGTCSIELSFAPRELGAREAVLEFTTSPCCGRSVPLLGTGVRVQVPSLPTVTAPSTVADQ
jgi:Cep192 domain 4